MSSSTLVAGQSQLKEFCEEHFNHSDPIIILFLFDEPPFEYKEEQVEGDIKIFIRQNFASLFFPKGFKKNCWNLVLASIDEENDLNKNRFKSNVIRGWINGEDYDSQAVLDGKYLIRV